MRTSPRHILILALACVTTLTGFGIRTSAQNRETRERALFVSAVDKDGEPVAGLGPEAFVVREDGVRREVLRVSRATEPIDIALLVDNSTAASDEITFLREALSKFVAKMAPGNNIAVITLADRPTIVVDYTNDTKRLGDAVGRLFSMPGSGMTLLDGSSRRLKAWRGEKRHAPSLCRSLPMAKSSPTAIPTTSLRRSTALTPLCISSVWASLSITKSTESASARSSSAMGQPKAEANRSRCSVRMVSIQPCSDWRASCRRSTK
jgi:VWFA-related protein